MRETANLKLTQFDGSDVPNWLDQYNSDNLKIDTAIGEQAVKNTEFSNTNENLQVQITNNRNQIDENTQDIANAKKDIADIRKGSSTSLEEIDKKFLETDAQISGLKKQVGSADFSNVGASITEIIGNTPITGNDTISHDLQAIHNDLDSIKDQNSRITNLEKSVGTASIKNVGNSITEAIGNESLPLSASSLSEAVNYVYGSVEVVAEDIHKLNQLSNTFLASAITGNVNTTTPKSLTVTLTFERQLSQYGILNNSSFIMNPTLCKDEMDNIYFLIAGFGTISNANTNIINVNGYAIGASLSTTGTYSFVNPSNVTFYKE